MRRNLKITYVVLYGLLGFLLLVSCYKKDENVSLSGNEITEVRKVSFFDEVEFNCIGDVELVQDDANSVEIICDSGIIKNIITNVVNYKLVVSINSKINLRNGRIKFIVKTKDYKSLVFNGTASVSGVKTITFKELKIHSNGTNTIDLSLTGEDLYTTVNGVGTVTLAGRTVVSSIEVNGTGSVNAVSLESVKSIAQIKGSGNIELNASDLLSVKISGVGDVRYIGNPKVDKQINGLGSVEMLKTVE